MKNFIRTVCLSVLTASLFSCKENQKPVEETLEEKAQRIHKKVITLDTHADINVANFTDSINYSQRLDTQVNLPKMKEGGLDVVWLIVYTGQDTLTSEGYEKGADNAMAKFKAIQQLCNEFASNEIDLALTSDDVRRIVAEGKKVAMIGVENAYPMGEDITNFQKYYDLGARYISLSHNGHSQFSDSNTGEIDDLWLHNGLSELGKKAVAEMNRLGIMIDISHPSKEAMNQMVALSKVPIIASHSSARALCNHSRNLDDEQLLLLKQNGGVVQTVAFSSYLNTEKHEAHATYLSNLSKKIADSLGLQWYDRKALRSLSPEERAAVSASQTKITEIQEEKLKSLKDVPPAVSVIDLVDHIDYMVKLIGIDHVGISSDFDGGGGIEGWSDASETFNVTLELVKRGYTEEEIAQLWGGNLLRVLDEVQAYATKS